jgi:FtsH-binding integral membrane protein
MFAQNNYFGAAVGGRKIFDEGLRSYMLKIYNLMSMALVLTGLSAFIAINFEPVRDLLFTFDQGRIGYSGLGTLLSISPIFIGIYFFWGYGTMDAEKSKVLFWVYSILTGISLSILGFLYTGESITKTFFITASLFAAMSIYGHTTKRDLTSFGSLLSMGVIGILIASLVNLFIGSTAVHFAISVVGVLVFTGMVAWDTYKLKQYYIAVGGGEAGQKMAIVGAFSLYLDFINLFLYILRFAGERKE